MSAELTQVELHQSIQSIQLTQLHQLIQVHLLLQEDIIKACRLLNRHPGLQDTSVPMDTIGLNRVVCHVNQLRMDTVPAAVYCNVPPPSVTLDIH